MPFETDVGKTLLAPMTIYQGAKQGDWGKVAFGGTQGFGYAYWAMKSKLDGIKNVGCEIIFWGIVFLMVERVTCGSPTNAGESFTAAAENWGDANAALANAAVDPNYWSGEAATAYDAQNSEQMARTVAMQQIDSDVAKILAGELKDLQYITQRIDWEIAVLMAAVPIAVSIALAPPPVGGQAQSNAFQLAIVGAATSYIAVLLDGMRNKSSRNAERLKTQKWNYQQIAQGATTVMYGSSATVPAGDVSSATKTFVGEFDDPGAAAPESVTSDTATTQAASGASAKSAPLSASTASTGAGETSGEASPAAPSEGQQPQTGAAPAYMTPTMGQATSGASQASTQAATFSQGASSAQQGQPKATSGQPPAKEAAAEQGVPAQDIGAAAAGTGGSERAPIDVSAGSTEPGQEPTPA